LASNRRTILQRNIQPMTRDEYIKHPAISASRIKRFYTGDISYAQKALTEGAAFHFDLLEQPFEDMPATTQNVYNAIHEVAMLGELFDKAQHEYIALNWLTIDGLKVHGKGMMDLCWIERGIIADVKTTSAKNIQAFAYDMVKHCNHVQAVWYSMLMGWSPKDFYYIGVPPKVKKSGNFKDLYLYRHNDAEIESATQLIINYLHNGANG
jgi:hypothetical protein